MITILYRYIFYKEGATDVKDYHWDSPGVSSPMTNGTNSEVMNLEVSGANSIKMHIEGRVGNQTEANWSTIGSVALYDYSIVTDITQNGIYSIGLGGISQVRIVIEELSGNCQVLGGVGQ